jgi:hypothetical protein
MLQHLLLHSIMKPTTPLYSIQHSFTAVLNKSSLNNIFFFTAWQEYTTILIHHNHINQQFWFAKLATPDSELKLHLAHQIQRVQ